MHKSLQQLFERFERAYQQHLQRLHQSAASAGDTVPLVALQRAIPKSIF